jgi:EpsI family protein
MSAADVSRAPAPVSSPVVRPARGAPLNGSSWFRVGLACAILLASAGVRYGQMRRIEGELAAGRLRPKFDLEQLPINFGVWKGESAKIDPQIVRGTGAEQIITRRYVNQDTGTAVEVIVLYGPAADVYQHAPEICYPAAGFTQAGGPDDLVIQAGPYQAPFRALVYSKGDGAQADLQEVYYSWWYNGHWTPNVGKQKHFERIPGMFKVHLARRVTSAEKRDVGNPCAALLKELLPEMQRRMAHTDLPSS